MTRSWATMGGPQISEEGPSLPRTTHGPPFKAHRLQKRVLHSTQNQKNKRPDTFATGGPHVSEGATKQECGSVLVVTVTVRSLPYPLRVNQN